MQSQTVTLDSRPPARVWTGGPDDRAAQPVVLLHGGWGGAESHWSPIADDLAATHRVIAPELPGLGNTDAPPLGGFRAYADWLKDLLDALGIDKAAVVGNAFGATVAWCFASMYPERCRSLVMVNGFPPPRYNAVVRWLTRETFVRRAARSQLSQNIYGPDALRTGFADPGKVPAEIATLLRNPPPARIEGLLDIYLSDEPVSPPPTVPAMVLFGEADRVPLIDTRAGRRFGATLDDGDFVRLTGAGHLPQLERPADFLRELRGFLNRASKASR